MVAVGIITVINIMIFASYPEFSQKWPLKRTSEEVALIVRQAQAYAQGIKRPVSGGEDYLVPGLILTKVHQIQNLYFIHRFRTNPNKIYDARWLRRSPIEFFRNLK